MNNFLLTLTIIGLWLLLQVFVDSLNPCSQFSDHPEECSSDGVRR